MKKYIIAILVFILPLSVLAGNITVPKASGSGYGLLSLTSGRYEATTTSPWRIGSLYASSTSLSSYFGGNVGIGTTSPSTLFHVSAGSSSTTTIDIGAISTSAKTCINVRNTTGGAVSFYFVGTTMVVENSRCK